MSAENQPEIQDTESHSIQDIIGRYLPYWPLFIILIAIGAGIAYLKLRKATPIYQANAMMMIKNDEQQGYIMEQLNMGKGYKNMQNEIAIMRSRPIAEAVVRNLHLYAPIVQEGRIRTMSSYASSPVVFRMQNPDSMKGVGRVSFMYDQKTRTVTFGGQTYPLNQFVNTPYGVMQILPNPHAPEDPIHLPMFFSLVSPAAMAGTVQSGLSIAPGVKESSLVNLSYNDESPERAVDILNEVVKVYNVAAINDKNKISANTMRFLEDRLRYVEADLDSIEKKIENFKSTNRIVDIGSQGQQYLTAISGNDQRTTNIDIQMSILDEVQRYVQSKKDKDILVPAGVEDPILSGQLQRLYEAESQQAVLQKTTGENYPELSSLTTQINRLKPTILESIRNQRQNLLATKSDIQGNSGRYNSLLSGLPAQERALINIDRQQAIKNTIYTFLLQKREETGLTFAAQVADSRLVNDAQPGGIVYPAPNSVYLQWIFVGIIAGVLFVFIRENLNRNVNSRPEMEKLTKVPVIAEIAHSRTKEAIVVESGNRSLVAEQFRYLRTSLSYIGINPTHKKILFTSSISGEGKSFITTNLAATLALTGKRVIMLEMDLRKPKLSEMMGLDRNTGLSDYLIGNKSLSEIVKITPISNLFLISSGAIPPNPAELLLNGSLPELLVQLEASYDYILIDTAPVSPVTDAYIISPLCDATLYVVRQNRTPRVLLQKLNDIVRSTRLKNVSVVFNGVKQKRFGSYYGYGYTYGYGYLDEKKKKKVTS